MLKPKNWDKNAMMTLIGLFIAVIGSIVVPFIMESDESGSAIIKAVENCNYAKFSNQNSINCGVINHLQK